MGKNLLDMIRKQKKVTNGNQLFPNSPNTVQIQPMGQPRPLQTTNTVEAQPVGRPRPMNPPSTTTDNNATNTSTNQQQNYLRQYMDNVSNTQDQPLTINQLMNQSQEMLNPLIDQQKQTATSAMNQQMQQLGNQWASRGLLASGVAATQENQAAQALASQLAGIDAQGQAQALENAYNLGNFQENQRQFDLSHALQEGSLTGTYEGEQTQAAREFAERLTQEQNQFDQNLDLSNRQLEQNQTQFDSELEQRNNQFDREMDLQEDSTAWEQRYRQRQQNYDEWQRDAENKLARQGMDIEKARLRLDSAMNQSDIQLKEHQMRMGINEEQARRSTNQAMAEVMSADDRESAYTWLLTNAEELYNDGVDVASVMEAIRARFGEPSTGESGFLTGE